MKIADFGVSKRFKDTVLKTQAGSWAYMAPELLGLLPRELMGSTYTKAVDIWSLGCLVHEVLTAEIPFLEMISGNSTGVQPGDLSLQRTDFAGFKSFCDGTTEFPLDSLQRSGANDTAVRFLKTLLVADPKCRPLAKDALLSKWLPQRAGTTSLDGDRVVAPVRRVTEGMIDPPTGIARAAGGKHRLGHQVQGFESATSAFQSPIPRHTYPPARDLGQANRKPVLDGGHTVKLTRSDTHEFRPLPGTLKRFRSEMRAAGRDKREAKVRWALNLSYPYISMVTKFGTDTSMENVVNAGMLVLRDAVENQYPTGLSLVTKAWANVLLRAIRKGRSSLLESELGLCVQDVSSLVQDGRIVDARNLVTGGLELFMQVCRVGDSDLIELVAGVWVKAFDDSITNVFGDEILLILATYCEHWVTAVKGRDITEIRALIKAGTGLLLASGRAEGKGLQKEIAAFCLYSVHQVLNPRDPDMQHWVLNNLNTKAITYIDIGKQDEEFAKLIVGIGVEFFLAMAQPTRGNRYNVLRANLLSSSTKILEKIVLAGHLQSAKTTIENIAEKKFTELAGGVSDRLRDDLEANLLGILQAVSVAIPVLQPTIENLKNTIKIFRVIFSTNGPNKAMHTI